MKKWLLNLSLKNKVLASASAAILALLVLGASYFGTVSQLEYNKNELHKVEGVTKNALNMKFAMAHSLKLLMEVITTDNVKDVDMFFNEHLAIIVEYDKNYAALEASLKDHSWGEKYALLKKELQERASVLDKFHEARLQPSVEKVYKLKQRTLAGDTNVATVAEINQIDDALDIEAESVLNSLNKYIDEVDLLSNNIQLDSEVLAKKAKLQGIVCVVLGLVMSLVAFYFLITYVINNMKQLTNLVQQLSEGKLPSNTIHSSDDELGQISASLNVLTEGLRTTSKFANEIGTGNFDIDFKPLSEADVLGDSLLKMRNSLKDVAAEDKKRNWATQGMAQFADILRNNTEGLEALANNIIINLVKYVGANQGSLFVVNDNNTRDIYLDMVACYAWDKKKYIHTRINEGDGLVGQAWQEADVIYLTQVPQNYITITSGLGGANPSSILIVPLTVNEITYGVIEIASFNLFDTFQIDFVKKLAESIASTLSTAKTNERTKFLLEQSQQQAEEMRAQEEEMRQNMEEMQATSEEAERKSLNYEAAIQRLNDEIRELSDELKKFKG
jgi:methyl-accepting chemotaxis protein